MLDAVLLSISLRIYGVPFFCFKTIPILRAKVAMAKWSCVENENLRVSKPTKWNAFDRSQLYASNKIIMFDIFKMRSIAGARKKQEKKR